jgi:hypothetical protein
MSTKFSFELYRTSALSGHLLVGWQHIVQKVMPIRHNRCPCNARAQSRAGHQVDEARGNSITTTIAYKNLIKLIIALSAQSQTKRPISGVKRSELCRNSDDIQDNLKVISGRDSGGLLRQRFYSSSDGSIAASA